MTSRLFLINVDVRTHDLLSGFYNVSNFTDKFSHETLAHKKEEKSSGFPEKCLIVWIIGAGDSQLHRHSDNIAIKKKNRQLTETSVIPHLLQASAHGLNLSSVCVWISFLCLFWPRHLTLPTHLSTALLQSLFAHTHPQTQ